MGKLGMISFRRIMRNQFIFVALGCCAVASAAPIIRVTPTLAPNAFGSPSYGSWVSNSFNALYNGVTSAGTAGLPTYYEAQSLIADRREVIVTGFNSWKGQANPGGAFSAELGNRMLFGLVIDGGGTKFSISDLMFNATSTGDGNGLGFGFGFGSYNYSNDYVGILYGVDGVMGGGDDTFVTAGANTLLVDGLVGRGSGSSYAAYTTDPGATNQDKIDLMAAANPWETFTGTYTLRVGTQNYTGANSFQVVPEPMTMSLMGIGAVTAFRRIRRRKA